MIGLLSRRISPLLGSFLPRPKEKNIAGRIQIMLIEPQPPVNLIILFASLFEQFMVF
jgi:hypothetical protein